MAGGKFHPEHGAEQVEGFAWSLAMPGTDIPLRKPVLSGHRTRHSPSGAPQRNLLYHGVPGHVLFRWVINAKCVLEHGVHPGAYYSASSLPLFSLSIPSGMRRTNSAVNHREAAQHMGSICISSDRNLAATFPSHTHKRNKQTKENLTNL